MSRTGGLGPGLGAHVGDGGLGFALVTFGAPSLRRLSLRIGRRKPSASRRCKLRIEFCLTLNGKKKKIKKRQTESKRRVQRARGKGLSSDALRPRGGRGEP